ncbi:MAG: ABC transporter permease subunit [Sumerlaeia bacterium]
MYPVYLIAKSVLIEALRRKEIYAIILVSLIFIGAVMTVDFFELDDIEKFYREIALRVMSIATALTVIVLSTRQLPREFETRTIYPLLAKPVSRAQFLLGKLAGVLAAALISFAMFMAIYILGVLYLQGNLPVVLFIQFLWLQIVMLTLISTMSFWLSMQLNLDAAMLISALLYAFASTFSAMATTLYEVSSTFGRGVLVLFNYLVPQLVVFDLSEKAVHANEWAPLSLETMVGITIYGGVYIGIFFGLTLFSFRRRAL